MHDLWADGVCRKHLPASWGLRVLELRGSSCNSWLGCMKLHVPDTLQWLVYRLCEIETLKGPWPQVFESNESTTSYIRRGKTHGFANQAPSEPEDNCVAFPLHPPPPKPPQTTASVQMPNLNACSLARSPLLLHLQLMLTPCRSQAALEGQPGIP